jgi:hypothetical protein
MKSRPYSEQVENKLAAESLPQYCQFEEIRRMVGLRKKGEIFLNIEELPRGII